MRSLGEAVSKGGYKCGRITSETRKTHRKCFIAPYWWRVWGEQQIKVKGTSSEPRIPTSKTRHSVAKKGNAYQDSSMLRSAPRSQRRQRRQHRSSAILLVINSPAEWRTIPRISLYKHLARHPLEPRHLARWPRQSAQVALTATTTTCSRSRKDRR